MLRVALAPKVRKAYKEKLARKAAKVVKEFRGIKDSKAYKE